MILENQVLGLIDIDLQLFLQKAKKEKR